MTMNTQFSISKQALVCLACVWRMISTPLLATAVLAATLGVATTTAQAACYDDIQSLPCWGPDKKCNIKFRNHTGRGSGSGGSEYNQVTQVKTVKVWAETADGKNAGSKKLSILADASKTINLDNKQDFDKIKIVAIPHADFGDTTLTMSCSDIQSILNGTGNCKVFMHGKREYAGEATKSWVYYVSYSCDGGKVKRSSVDN